MRFLVFRCFFDQPIVQSPNRKIAGDRKVYRVCVCVVFYAHFGPFCPSDQVAASSSPSCAPIFARSRPSRRGGS